MRSIIVRLVLFYIIFWARLALTIHRPIVIGITGSAGKTSTRDVIYAMLKDVRKVHVVKKGNSETGLPLGILGMQVHSIGFDSIHRSIFDWLRMLLLAPMRVFFLHRFRYLIIEMGVDDPLPPKNMGTLLNIVKPDISVLLNVYPVHAAAFEKVVSRPVTEAKLVKAIALEKAKIVTHNRRCTYAVFNGDSKELHDILDDIPTVKETFGTSEDNQLMFKSYKISVDASHFGFSYGSEKLTLHIKNYALPEVYRESFAAAILIGQHIGLTFDQIKHGIEKNFALEPGRSTLLSGVEDTTILDSSYNASPQAVISMLKLAVQLKSVLKKNLIFVFGDMRELGHAEKSGYESVVQAILGNVDYLYTVGPITHRHVYERFKNKRSFKDIKSFHNPHEAGKHLKKTLPRDALVLFKGSQNTIFLEEAIKYILERQEDIKLLPRQEDYWLRKKQFTFK